jgi:hypothetical protein
MITLHLVSYNPENNFRAEKGNSVLVNLANVVWATRKKSNTGDVTTIYFSGVNNGLDVWETYEEIQMLAKGKK